MTDEFTGKVVLVTGATRGLGYAIARGFAAAGATVVVSSRKQDACERAAEAITSETGVRADALAFHVGRWDTITPAVDEVYSRHGRLDVVVNNAGIAPLAPSLVEVSEALFDKTIEVNLKGPFRLTAVAGARMAKAGGRGGRQHLEHRSASAQPTGGGVRGGEERAERPHHGLRPGIRAACPGQLCHAGRLRHGDGRPLGRGIRAQGGRPAPGGTAR